MDITEIIVSAIAAAGAVSAAGAPALLRQRAENAALKREMEFQMDSLSFDEFVEDWAPIHIALDRLLNGTRIDRFLILRAWNGERAPEWTKSIFQWRGAGQPNTVYAHFKLDDDYVNRLNHCVYAGPMVMVTADIQPSAIKSVYESEGVKSAVWFHISSSELDGSNSKAITYCSFATHSADPIDDATVMACRLIVDRIAEVAYRAGQKKGSVTTNINPHAGSGEIRSYSPALERAKEFIHDDYLTTGGTRRLHCPG